MPQLDSMLRALEEKGADELLLADGRKPVFRIGQTEHPISQMVLNRNNIIHLVSELAGKDEAASLHHGQSVSFVYRLPDGSPFQCDAGDGNGGFLARVVTHSHKAAIELPAVESPKKPVPNVTKKEPDAMPKAAPAVPTEHHDTPAVEQHLIKLVESEGSDLHLSANETPMLRLHGDMMPMEGMEPCSPEEIRRLLFDIIPPKNQREFEETNDTDFAYEIPDVARFRVNVFMDRKGIGGVFRVIPSKILTAEDLNLPKAVLDLCHIPKGLVLVTGPSGSGKSTTLAAMVDHINRTRTDHIITIEDPIEFVHPTKNCLINQREIGTHTTSFKKALRAALREDPDIVLVGEMRDLETIAIAIETAETGHLVFGTLHTTTAPSTVDRIIDQFPADRQEQIRTMLSESLKGVIAQNLLKRIAGGRVAALEILIGTHAISSLIRDGKTFQIPSIMQTGKKKGMVLLNDALLELVKSRTVAPEEAYDKAIDKTGFANQLRNAGFKVPAATE